MTENKELDIVVWGASGFTGKLVAEYLFKKYAPGNSINWAIAGRNQTKLEKIRSEIADESIPIIIADSQDELSLNEMVQRTKVMCTTVGPYAKYGSKLVAACVKHKTDYCDLTGEVQWMRHMIDQHQETAKANGTKIVHACGFDSIPSDMGVYFMQKSAMAKTGKPAKQIKMRVRAFKGGLSGGTYASLTNVLAEARADKSIYSTLLNPYGLNPKGEDSGPDKPDLQSVIYDKTAKSWIYPFIMAGINTKVVRRSNALSDYLYGKDFRYDEAVLSGDGLKGRVKGISSTLPLALMMLKPDSFIKKMIDKKLPKPGEGPGKAARENGFYNLKFFVMLQDDKIVIGKVTGDMDPGYGSTSKMLAESAICLAKDDLPDTSGVLTPAIAMGDKLLQRLQNNAGLTFELDF